MVIPVFNEEITLVRLGGLGQSGICDSTRNVDLNAIASDRVIVLPARSHTA